MTVTVPSSVSAENRLCLSCGLCCNGVLFGDVKLQAEDNAALLRKLGLSIQKVRFKQPCVALDGCRCKIYADRPAYCHKFECLLLKRVHSGHLDQEAALKTIKTAREKIEAVTRLLRSLGDENEAVPLRVRFRNISRKFEKVPSAKSQAHDFAELTQEMHALNLLLSDQFLPDPA
jgi:Fe-S-cluster containining protein